jgi:hypothetical protein
MNIKQYHRYLNGGMEALRERPELVRSLDRITAVALDEQLRSDPRPLVLDVRTEEEWNAGHIHGSHKPG